MNKLTALTRLAPALALSVAAATSTYAQDDDAPAISAFGSFDINSHFMSYGWDVWGAGTGSDMLFQPSFGIDAYLGGGMGVYAGIWMDINDLAGGTSTGDIQEVDVFVGTYFSAGPVSFDLAYQQWYWASDEEHVVDLSISYDTLFSPYVLIHARVQGNDNGGTPEEGVVIEVGGSHAFDLSFAELSLSAAIGYVATDDFHGDGDTGIGYYNVGADIVIPVTFIPAGLGEWDIHGGVDFYHTPEDVVPLNPEETFFTYNVGFGFAF